MTYRIVMRLSEPQHPMGGQGAKPGLDLAVTAFGLVLAAWYA
jgi:hypothetical protein